MSANEDRIVDKKCDAGNHIHLKTKPVLWTCGFILLVIYIGISIILKNLDTEKSFELVQTLIILNEIVQLGFSSIIIGAIINITDLKDIYGEIKENISGISGNIFGKQAECCNRNISKLVEDYGMVVQKIENNFNYISVPETIPYSIMSDNNLDVLIRSAVIQKTENTKRKIEPEIKKIYNSYIDALKDTYVEKLTRLGRGSLNTRFSRRIIITIDNSQNSLKIETHIDFNLYLPPKADGKTYTHTQRFRSEEDAKSLSIDSSVNGSSINCDMKIGNDEKKNKLFPYYWKHKFSFEEGIDNIFSLTSTYNYYLGKDTSYRETYYVSDACCNYKFEVLIKGKDAAFWDIQASCTEGKQNSGEGKSLGFIVSDDDHDEEDIKRVVIATNENRWVMEGTVINILIRKAFEDV